MRGVDFRSRVSWAWLLGVLCIALVLMSGMVQAAHFHALGQVDHDCALCVAAHHIAQAPAAIVLLFSSRAVARVAAPRSIQHPRRPVYFRLVSRPPPVDSCLFA